MHTSLARSIIVVWMRDLYRRARAKGKRRSEWRFSWSDDFILQGKWIVNERQEERVGCEAANEKWAHGESERADVGDQAFNGEVQLEPHLERDGPLLSPLVAGYNHTTSSAGWMTFRHCLRLRSDITSWYLWRFSLIRRVGFPVIFFQHFYVFFFFFWASSILL